MTAFGVHARLVAVQLAAQGVRGLARAIGRQRAEVERLGRGARGPRRDRQTDTAVGADRRGSAAGGERRAAVGLVLEDHGGAAVDPARRSDAARGAGAWAGVLPGVDRVEEGAGRVVLRLGDQVAGDGRIVAYVVRGVGRFACVENRRDARADLAVAGLNRRDEAVPALVLVEADARRDGVAVGGRALEVEVAGARGGHLAAGGLDRLAGGDVVRAGAARDRDGGRP